TLTTFGQNYNVSLLGASNNITTDTTFINTGSVTLGDAVTDTTTFAGGLDTTAASGTSTAGRIRTTNSQMDLGDTSMSANTNLDSGNAALNIASVTDGVNSFTLNLQDNGGTGDVTFAGGVTINTLTTNAQAYAVNFHGGGVIDTDTNFANTGGLALGDDTTDSLTFTGGLSTGTNPVSTAGTVATVNTSMDLGAVTMGANTFLQSGTGPINVTSITDGASSFTLNLQNAGGTGDVTFIGGVTVNGLTTNAQGYGVVFSGGGTIDTATTFNNTGTTQFGDASGDVMNFIGGVTAIAGAVNVAGTINTTNANATLGAVNIIDGEALTVDTGTGAGNIVISSISGSTTTTTGENVTLISGSGTTTVSGTIGTDIGILTLQENAGTSTGAVSLEGNVMVHTLTTFAQNYAVSLTGGGTITTAVTFNNTGGVQIGDATADTFTFTGGVDNGTSAVTAAGQINTTNADAIFDDGILVVDGQTLTLDTGAGTGNISISTITGSVTTTTGENVRLISGAGTTTVTGNIGTDIGILQLQENAVTSTGAVTFEGNVEVNSLATFGQNYNVVLQGAANTITNAVTFNNTGGVTIGDGAGDVNTFTGGVTSTASVTNISGTLNTVDTDIELGSTANGVIFNTDITISTNGGSGGDVTVAGEIVAGANTVTIDSGIVGDISMTNANNVMGNITVTSANNVSIRENDNITQGGAWVAGGDVALDAGGSNVILADNDNEFGTLSITANEATVTEKGGTELAATNVAGTYALTTMDDGADAGNVTQSGTVAASTLEIDASGQVDLPLNNSVGTLQNSISVGGFKFIDSNDLIVANIDSGNGRLEIISTGNFFLNGVVNSGSGTIAVGTRGAGEFIAGAAGNILTTTGSSVNDAVIYGNTGAGTVLGSIGIDDIQNNTTYPQPSTSTVMGLILLLQEPVSIITPPVTGSNLGGDTVIVGDPFAFEVPFAFAGLDDEDLEEFLEGFLEGELGEIEIGVINIGDGDLQVSEELLAKLKKELSTEAKQDLLDAMQSLLAGGIDIREADLPEGLIYLENSRGESVVIPLSLLFEYLGRLLSEQEKNELLDAANSL
ncbi:MAG: hypothetical protein AAF649_11695, partial [Verrucomicrobiota bacterium]